MPSPNDRAAVHRALERWAAGDLEGTLAQLSEDILYLINVDGLRLRYWVESGLIVRAEGHLDAQYVETFQRLVFHIENAIRGV